MTLLRFSLHCDMSYRYENGSCFWSFKTLFGSYPYFFTTRAQILSYKGVGLNGGVILYNFTRLRSLPGGGMTEAIRFVWRRYKSDIRLADQDILNIIFGVSTQWETLNWCLSYSIFCPRYLYELPCVWNYHVFQCKPDKTENPPISRQRNGQNLCPQAVKVRPS